MQTKRKQNMHYSWYKTNSRKAKSVYIFTKGRTLLYKACGNKHQHILLTRRWTTLYFLIREGSRKVAPLSNARKKCDEARVIMWPTWALQLRCMHGNQLWLPITATTAKGKTLFFVFLGHTDWYFGLLLQDWGIIWDAWDQIQVGCVQGKQPICSSIAPAPGKLCF